METDMTVTTVRSLERVKLWTLTEDTLTSHKDPQYRYE